MMVPHFPCQIKELDCDSIDAIAITATTVRNYASAADVRTLPVKQQQLW